MANTKISDLGSRKIARSGLGEIRIPALGNGVAKPGDIVGITDSTGKVISTQLGVSELFRGILDDKPQIAEDTAITDSSPCMIIVPQSGRGYRVKIEDPAGAVVSGTPHTWSNTIGALEDQAALNTAGGGVVAINDDALVTGDVVADITWM